MSMVPALAAVVLAAGPVPVVQQFDFTFPSCLGVQAADNPFHVTTVSDLGQPSIHNIQLGPVVMSDFHDSGTYVAKPSRVDAQARAGRYTDHYVAFARGHVRFDATGAIETADYLEERRDIQLWDGGRPFFHETWKIDVRNYDENTTQPTVTDRCGP